MTKLTQPQQALLEAALAKDGAAATPESGKTAASLIKRGLLISLPRAGEPSRLLTTESGRTAIEVLATRLEPQPAEEQAIKELPAEVAEQPLPTAEPLPRPSGKLGAVVGLLRRPEGARLDELMTATGWQAHSVRGALAGAIKKKLNLPVVSEKTAEGRIYRIAEGTHA